MKVIKRWQELESAQKPAIQQTYAAALLEAGRLAMELEQAEAQLAIAAPKAEFVDRYVDATGTYGFRQVAKMLSVKENWFSDFLIEKAIMYRLSGRLTAHSGHIDAGRFVPRAGVAKNDHAFTECRFTAKGVEWVAGEIAKHKAVAAIAKK
jgi:phage antirepressor YoqD-like protein